MKSEIVLKAGIKRDKEYLYFISKEGDVCRVKMSRKGRRKGTTNR
jgi:hypothetical protein